MRQTYDAKVGSLLSAAQDVTASWVDLGSEVETWGSQTITLWVNVDINSSNNIRVRALAKHTSAGTDEYVFPIETAGTSDVDVEDHYFEFNVDADQKMILNWNLNGTVPYIQFQVQAGTVG